MVCNHYSVLPPIGQTVKMTWQQQLEKDGDSIESDNCRRTTSKEIEERHLPLSVGNLCQKKIKKGQTIRVVCCNWKSYTKHIPASKAI